MRRYEETDEMISIPEWISGQFDEENEIMTFVLIQPFVKLKRNNEKFIQILDDVKKCIANKHPMLILFDWKNAELLEARPLSEEEVIKTNHIDFG